ncbi:MAG: thiamine pyrophosphate-binding protein, partial [Sphingomicrobium sp.]
KFTGQVGVCLATSGPGAIHLLNGLYDAKLDHQPVVAIVGQQARSALGGHYQQEVDLISLFKDVASEYVHMCSVPTQARQQLTRYPTIRLINARADSVSGALDNFSVRTGDGEGLKARRLILSYGIVDQIPAVPGFAEAWGTAIVPCP